MNKNLKQWQKYQKVIGTIEDLQISIHIGSTVFENFTSYESAETMLLEKFDYGTGRTHYTPNYIEFCNPYHTQIYRIALESMQENNEYTIEQYAIQYAIDKGKFGNSIFQQIAEIDESLALAELNPFNDLLEQAKKISFDFDMEFKEQITDLQNIEFQISTKELKEFVFPKTGLGRYASKKNILGISDGRIFSTDYYIIVFDKLKRKAPDFSIWWCDYFSKNEMIVSVTKEGRTYLSFPDDNVYLKFISEFRGKESTAKLWDNKTAPLVGFVKSDKLKSDLKIINRIKGTLKLIELNGVAGVDTKEENGTNIVIQTNFSNLCGKELAKKRNLPFVKPKEMKELSQIINFNANYFVRLSKFITKQKYITVKLADNISGTKAFYFENDNYKALMMPMRKGE